MIHAPSGFGDFVRCVHTRLRPEVLANISLKAQPEPQDSGDETCKDTESASSHPVQEQVALAAPRSKRVGIDSIVDCVFVSLASFAFNSGG